MKPALASGRVQAQVLVPAPKPDETAWGHLHRVAALNNFDSAARLVTAWSGKRSYNFDSPPVVERALRFLENGEPKGHLQPYAWRHGLGYMLVLSSDATDYRLFDYYRRSALHEQGCLLPSRLRASFCRSCRRTSLETEGFSWYLRIHQVAGVEFCPLHSGRLEVQPIDHHRVLSNDFRLDERMEPLDGYIGSDLSISEISSYVGLVNWRWGDSSYSRLAAIHDLVLERAEASGDSFESFVFREIQDIAIRPQTKAWFEHHFQHLFSPFPRWRPKISLLHLALTLASHGDSIDQLVGYLERKQADRSASLATFFGGLRSKKEGNPAKQDFPGNHQGG